MNWNQSRFLFSMLLVISFNGVARSDVILQPPGLAPGDLYRLVFVTSTSRDATSSNIDDYNAFVQAAADASPLAALGATWRAIGSTAFVSARANTGTLSTGVDDHPIFRVDGVMVASSNSDLWDGQIQAPIQLTESSTGSCRLVWTGDNSSGNTADPFDALGGIGGSSILGWPCAPSGSAWFAFGRDDPNQRLALYALSSPIQAVPEPSSYALAGMALAVGGVWASVRRRSKKSHGSPVPSVPNA